MESREPHTRGAVPAEKFQPLLLDAVSACVLDSLPPERSASGIMRIRRVKVEKLFGIFDHDIELNEAEHITILSGPNGFGKTILLRMLDGFLRRNYDIFRRVPFAMFQVTFEDGEYLRLEPKENWKQEGWMGRWPAVALQMSSGSGKSFELDLLSDRGEPSRSIFLLSDSREQVDPWLTAVKRLTDEEMARVLGWAANRTGLTEKKEHLDWLRDLLATVRVRLIETQRLDITDEDPATTNRRHASGSTGRRPTVLRYAEDLAKRMKELLALSGARTQELDRTFPTRLLQQTTPTLATDELRDRLAQVDAKRAHLTELGFLAPEQHPAMPLPAALDQKRDVLSVYVVDAEEKLAVFDEMAAKVELLTRIINNLFLYKRMTVNPEEGFMFTAEPTGHRIAPDNLSSGEQHQLVLLYELLFLSPKGALVLLDEPEISLHAAWQERFLDDLEEMVALSGFDVLVATHSAEVIGEHWDLVVELKGPELREDPALADRAQAPEQGV